MMDCAQLWSRYKQQGDATAREALILGHTFLVRGVAERLSIAHTPYLDREDLASHGIVGLIDAVEKYDPERGPRFESYASARIRGAMLDAVRGMDWLPRSVRATATTLQRTAAQLEQTLGREPSPGDLAAATGIGIETVERVQAQVQGGRPCSLDSLVTTDATESASECLLLTPVVSDAAAAWPTPHEHAEMAEQRAILIEAIRTLPQDERLVLSLYYFEEMTLKEIGRVMGRTESRISQIHTKAMKRLRAHLDARQEVFLAA